MLTHLQRDGRSSYTSLAERCDVAEGTIRKRLRRLQNRGVLRIKGVADPARTGMDTAAVVWLRVERGKLMDVAAQITALHHAHYVAYTTGASDILAIVTLSSQDELMRFLTYDLGSIKNLTEVETSMVLKTYKQPYRWAPWSSGAPETSAGAGDTFEPDEIDLKIIDYLEQDGRMTFVTIAEALGITESTVRRRVTAILESKIMEIASIINPARVGYTTAAMIGIKVERARLQTVVQELTGLPEVRYLALSTGKYDLIIEVVQESNENLLDFLVGRLEELPGIIRTDTHLLLKLSKETYNWGVAHKHQAT